MQLRQLAEIRIERTLSSIIAGHSAQHLNSDYEEFEEIKYTSIIQKLEAIIRSLNKIVIYLRALREVYRFNIKTLTTKNQALKVKIEALTIKEEEEAISKSLNFDIEDTKQSIKLKVSISIVYTTESILIVYITKYISTSIETNKKYSNILDYYSDKVE